jgi:hypothetical protein
VVGWAGVCPLPLEEQERSDLIAHYAELVRGFVAGRRWVAATDVLVGAAKQGKTLLDFGADRVIAIGGSRGTGELPEPEEMQCIDLEVKAEDMMSGIRQAMAALENLPDWACDEVNRFDPDHEAQVLGTIFCSDSDVGGRRVFGGRPKAWRDLEDKTIVDALWDAAGIPRTDSAIVPAERKAMVQTATRLDLGAGTVWVADNKEGWHGGGKMLRWVRTEAEAEAAFAFLSAHSDVVRIMPFLDGIPCSIHGWVFPEVSIGLRPCETLVFRRPGSDQLVYAGAATCWTPPQADRDAMRSMVVQVGDHLRETVGYRGSFTVDGVMTADGFRPTELNPRFGASLARMAAAMPDLPLYLLHLATAEGLDLDYRPHALERLIVSETEAHPQSRAIFLAEGRTDSDNDKVEIRREDDGRWKVIEEGEQRQGQLMIGPAAAGTILLAQMDQEFVSLGPSAAPDIIAAFGLADALWDLGIGALEPPPDLRQA